ncbi:MAG: stage II sporulation protein D [Clostridia bacterium]|nr:stage II sporulation protein D [Clostridia bacterium]
MPKKISWVILAALLLIFLLLCAAFFTIKGRQVPEQAKNSVQPTVVVWRTGEEKAETVTVEEAVANIVAAEMPVSFEAEALKAQAVAARTYVMSKLKQAEGTTPTSHPEGANICDDHKHCQAYDDKEECKAKWGDNYAAYRQKIEAAAAATYGQVVTYNGELISALYHSTCGGQTEKAGDYWSSDVPALQSVSCYWDSAAPKYVSEQLIKKEDMLQKLGVTEEELASLSIAKLSDSGRIMTISCGEKRWKGNEFRMLLGLNSTAFTWVSTAEGYFFSEQGYGHGVGMCQYGANGMAKLGKTYEEILEHYYTGVKVSQKY